MKLWFWAMRPWSLTAAAIPVALGGVLAWEQGQFDAVLFFLTLAGAVLLQAGTNYINTYGDYMSGVDTLESAKTCPQLVSGMVRPEQMKRAGMLAFLAAILCGTWLVYERGWPVLAFGMLGVLGGYGYTAGVWPYKYKGLGSILVFFLMGPMLVWPAYYIQTGQYSWLPVWISLPVAYLVAGILHGNDIRDMEQDRRAGIQTLALMLGLGKSLLLYFGLFGGAFVCLAILVGIGLLPWTSILPLVLLPALREVFYLVRQKPSAEGTQYSLLEADAAKRHFQFGFMMVLGIAVYPLTQVIR